MPVAVVCGDVGRGAILERGPVIRSVGRYELLEQVGSGGMAVVYRGRDTALDREVAVKLLHPHLAEAAESRARFSREARAVARLSHPGIVEIYDYAGEAMSEAYLVTEFVRGRTLRAFAREVGFGAPEIGLLVGRALADALVHAHSAGVIHRDLKPENVLVQEGDHPAVKLADFGIARILASEERMTLTGALVGSPNHMAPEIVEGKEADARSDLFSLGTILYWLSTGRLPFAASNPTAILRRSLEGAYDDPREVEPRVSGALTALLRRTLEVDPALRPGSAAEIRDALDDVLAEVGLDHPAEDLLRFLRAPAAFTAGFTVRAVETLLATGDAALAAGATARALAAYDRILALEPGNREVAGRLATLARRRRRRRWLSAGAAALLLGSAAALAIPRLAARRAAPASARAASAPAPGADLGGGASPGGRGLGAPAGAAAPPARFAGESEPAPAVDRAAPPGEGPARREAMAGPAASAPPHGRPLPPDAAPPGTAVLTVVVRPYAQRALLDGVERATGQQAVQFEIRPGAPHTIRIEHACCAPFVRELTAADAAAIGELRISLEPRPARLRVEGDPEARIFVDGAPVGTAAESQRTPIAVPVPRGGESPYEAPARIRLERRTGSPRTIDVRLRAGADLVVAAPSTEPSP